MHPSIFHQFIEEESILAFSRFLPPSAAENIFHDRIDFSQGINSVESVSGVLKSAWEGRPLRLPVPRQLRLHLRVETELTRGPPEFVQHVRL
jgi:hypothetical protein